MSKNLGKHVVQPLVCLVVLGGGVLLAVGMAQRQSHADKVTVVARAPLVTVQVAALADVPVVIEANGTVRARDVVEIMPQVEGLVVEVHPALRAGGAFAPDEVLIVIDPTDYDIEVMQAQAEIAQREAAVKDAEATISEFAIHREDVGLDAERLRDLFDSNSTTRRELDKAELALRRAEVQHDAATARRDSAHGAMRVAQARATAAAVRLQRTRIALPYAGRVIRESIDVAQYVVRGQALAEVYRTDAMEVILPLEDWQLAWFTVGGRDALDHEGAAVAIETEFAGAARTWSGRAVRLEGTVDPRSRMVRVVVEVCEPDSGDGSGTALMPGMFVTARIDGQVMEDVAALPRQALRRAGTVWIVSEGLLRIRSVKVVRQQRNRVFVRGLEDGAQVITSALDIVVEGMPVRPWNDRKKASRMAEEQAAAPAGPQPLPAGASNGE